MFAVLPEAPTASTSASEGVMSNQGKSTANAPISAKRAPSSSTAAAAAILRLQPSTRQTVVRTVTTTTIHYAPIHLPRPTSPELCGEYNRDRHAYPLAVAEQKHNARIREKSAGAEKDTLDCRSFALAFGAGGSTDEEDGLAATGQQDALKAVYSLDGDDADSDQLPRPSSPKVDRKGKGRAVSQGILEAPVIAGDRLPTPDFDASQQDCLPLPVDTHGDHKRKRRASADSSKAIGHASKTAALPRGTSATPSTSTCAAAVDIAPLQDDANGSGRSNSPPRKRQRTDAPLAQTTPMRSVRVSAAEGILERYSGSQEQLRKKAISANDAVLPSPKLSPRFDGLQDKDAEAPLQDSEKRLVPFERARLGEAIVGRSHPATASHVTEKTTVEQETPDEDDDDGQRQLAALAEGHTLATLMSLPSLVSEFSGLTPKLQASVLYQLLRQASTPVLQRVNRLVQPALKRDFISDLPAELALQVLLYLDSKTIMRCLLVCWNWKRFIDSQGQIWQELLKDEDLWIGGEPDRPAEAVENGEAEYWSAVGTSRPPAHSSTRRGGKQTRSARKKRAPAQLSSSSATHAQAVRGASDSSTPSPPPQPARELGIPELLAVNDWKSALFMRRWKQKTWDEFFDLDEAARPTADKLAALPANSETAYAGYEPALPATPGPISTKMLKRSSLRPRINEHVSSKTGTLSPPSAAQSLPPQGDYVHPFKLIYKKRVAVRAHWSSPEDPATSVHRTTFRGLQTSVITNLQFDNEKIVTASDDPTIDVYDTLTGELRMRLAGHDGGVWALQYTGNVLVSGSTDRTVRVWDLETGACTHVFYGHTSTVRCLQIVEPVNVNPDPNAPPVWEPPCPLIVTGSRDWTLRVWRLPYPARTSSLMPFVPPSPSDETTDPANNAYHLRVLRGHGLAVRALAAHGRTVVSGSYDCFLRVWDLLSGKCRHKLVGHTAKVYSVALDTARNRCSSGSMDGTVRIWSLETGEPLFRLDGHSSLVGLLGCSYHFLVSAGADSTLKVWDPNSGTCIETLSANAGAITCFKHDDFRIVSGCEGQLRVWDIRRGVVIKDVIQDMQGVWQLQFSDRFCIAAVSRDGATDFEILDFFPELREDRAIPSDMEEYRDALESMDEDGKPVFEDYVAGETDDDVANHTLHYDIPPSQNSMYQTPRGGPSSTPKKPPSRKHIDGYYHYMSDPSAPHHHHYRHRHHHHHGSQTMHRAGASSRSLKARTTSNNTATTMSAVIAEEPSSLEDLFAYSADHNHPTTTYHGEPQAGLSGYQSGSDQHLHYDGAQLNTAQAALEHPESFNETTPEIKQEEGIDEPFD